MLQEKNNLTDKEKEQVISLIREGKNIRKELLYKIARDDEDVFLFWNGRSKEGNYDNELYNECRKKE